MTGVAADDHHAAVAADDLAVVTNLLYRGVDLHEVSFESLASYRRGMRRPFLIQLWAYL